MNREQAENNVRKITDAMMEGELTHELEGMLVKSIAWLAFDIADSLAVIAGTEAHKSERRREVKIRD